MDCTPNTSGVCSVCGRRPREGAPCRPGLGDMVAIAAGGIGITEELADAAASYLGLASCGCAGRRAFLNRAGRYFGIGDSTAETGLTAIPDKAEPKK